MSNELLQPNQMLRNDSIKHVDSEYFCYLCVTTNVVKARVHYGCQTGLMGATAIRV